MSVEPCREPHPKGKRWWKERNREAKGREDPKMRRGVSWEWWHIPVSSSSWKAEA